MHPRLLLFLINTPQEEYWLFERSVEWYQAHYGIEYKEWILQDGE